MQLATSKSTGTCVIGELTDSAAFASIAFGDAVWAKRYLAVKDAVTETRKLGLVDRLFAVVAPRYIELNRTPCLSPLYGKVNARKLEAAGFRRTDEVGSILPITVPDVSVWKHGSSGR